MKKISKLIFISLASLLLMGCEKETEPQFEEINCDKMREESYEGTTQTIVCEKEYKIDDCNLWIYAVDREGKIFYSINWKIHDSFYDDDVIDNIETANIMYYIYEKGKENINFENVDKYSSAINVLCEYKGNSNTSIEMFGIATTSQGDVSLMGYSHSNGDEYFKDKFPEWLDQKYVPDKKGFYYVSIKAAIEDFMDTPEVKELSILKE